MALVLGRKWEQRVVVVHRATGHRIIVGVRKPGRENRVDVRMGFFDDANLFKITREEIRMNETPPTQPPPEPDQQTSGTTGDPAFPPGPGQIPADDEPNEGGPTP